MDQDENHKTGHYLRKTEQKHDKFNHPRILKRNIQLRLQFTKGTTFQLRKHLGTNSIGWAIVNEAENEKEKSNIVKLGVRVNPLTVDELQNFEKGKSITTNADRTLKRSMRRNLQRFKLRKENLIEVLKAVEKLNLKMKDS